MKIEIYTKDNCGYCVAAKSLLDSKKMEYVTYNMPEQISLEDLKEKFPHARTFPVIVINGEWIGGFDQLQQVIGGR